MKLLSRIKAARRVGRVIVGHVDQTFETVGQAAQAFTLANNVEIYRQIEPDQAITVLVEVLHRDMAYNQKQMAADTARAFAVAFVDGFPRATTRYYTNGTFGLGRASPSWSPATSATFDTGVVAMSATATACVWCADEA